MKILVRHAHAKILRRCFLLFATPQLGRGVEKQVNKVAGGGLQNARESKRRLQTDLWTDGQYSKNSPS